MGGLKDGFGLNKGGGGGGTDLVLYDENPVNPMPNTVTGDNAVAIGDGCTASGNYSHAEGENNTASGFGSHSQNLNTKAESLASTAIGAYNIGGGNPITWIATDPLFEIGIGTGDLARANALTVYKNGYIVPTIPSYVDDAAADADTNLPSGGLYKLNAGRAIYQKP